MPMLDSRLIVQRFLDTKMQVHPDVVKYIREKDDPGLIDRIIESLPVDTVVVSVKHIPGITPDRDGSRFLSDPSCEVVKGQAGSCGCITSIHDYIHYFRDRYNRLGTIIRGRCSPMPIEGLQRNSRYRQENCTIAGLIMETKSTSNGHRMAELEDPTGSISVLFHKERPGFAEADALLPDELIAVRGTLSNDGRLFFAEQLFRPDIPLHHAPYLSQYPGKAVFISDVHVGSNTFLEDPWNKFADWLDDSGASYLLIAGDLVDGIGV